MKLLVCFLGLAVINAQDPLGMGDAMGFGFETFGMAPPPQISFQPAASGFSSGFYNPMSMFGSPNSIGGFPGIGAMGGIQSYLANSGLDLPSGFRMMRQANGMPIYVQEVGGQGAEPQGFVDDTRGQLQQQFDNAFANSGFSNSAPRNAQFGNSRFASNGQNQNWNNQQFWINRAMNGNNRF